MPKQIIQLYDFQENRTQNKKNAYEFDVVIDFFIFYKNKIITFLGQF